MPDRFKTIDELTPAEHAERQVAQRQGEPWQPPETDEYRSRRREVLERAGLEPDTEDRAAAKSIEDMTPEDHANRRKDNAA